MVLLGTVGRMETKVIKQRCICVRELLCSMNQGCSPPCEYLAEYLILCQGVQHVEQDGVRTFSGGAAFTGGRYWKASVPLRLPVLRGFKSILGFPFKLGCPCWWCQKGLSERQGPPKVPSEKGDAIPERQKIPDSSRSIPTPRRVWMSYHQLLLSALRGGGGDKLNRNGSLLSLQDPERSPTLLRMEMTAIRKRFSVGLRTF